MIQYPATFNPKDGFEATKRGTDDSLPMVIKARRAEEIGRSPSAYSTPESSPPRQVPGPKTPPETPLVVRKLQSRWDQVSKIPGVPDIRKELNTERDALSRPSTSKETPQSLFWHDPEEELIWSDQEVTTEKKLDDKVAAAGKLSTEDNEKLTSKPSHGKVCDEMKGAEKPKVRDYENNQHHRSTF
uniref:Uncharacterized protein n=1 Tax=Tetranychus urticae TaxID=32264 RepID=T1L3W9_TETUR